MPSARGSHKVKPAKTTQVDTSAPPSTAIGSFMTTKPIRRNSDWRSGISKPSFMSRIGHDNRSASVVSLPIPAAQEQLCRKDSVAIIEVQKLNVEIEKACTVTVISCTETAEEIADTPLPDQVVEPVKITQSSTTYTEEILDTCEALAREDTQSSTSSIYSRDRLSVCSSDAASVYSSASSIYSSAASIYSLEEENGSIDPRRRLQRTQTGSTKRPEVQDAAARERSSLAKKAALFKNSRLRPDLPSYTTSLPTWSMVCRAAQASDDCYDSCKLTRRGTYTPADTAKNIKAMIVDDQLIDNCRLIIIAIRGTQSQSLADWSVNKSATPIKPTDFLDDEENACHDGFLQVAKAMQTQVATSLQQHPALNDNASLLFTGHSAGGAVAAMLYSHMLSTAVSSDLTALASQFSSINCVTFGAPPISATPITRTDGGSGVFLAFTNEGDPVTRLGDAAYMKTLARLMTASPPSTARPMDVPPPVKVVRSSRGTRVIREKAPVAPVTPWEELPLWPTPPAPLVNAGDSILLREGESGLSASRAKAEDFQDVIFGDFAQHSMDVYLRRINEAAFAAMTGRM